MNRVKIVTDSTVDVPREELKALGVEVVPLTITVDGKSYLDGVDISPSDYIPLLKQSQEIPRTSQPAAGVFTEVYDRLGEDGSEIISIHLTSGMSGTFNSAQSAAQMSKSKVLVIDSKFISFALGFQVIEAAKMAEQGKNVEEIVNRLKTIRDNTSLFIMVDTLDYLVKGGRIGRGKALIGSLLKIKPIASLADGIYTPVSKVRTYVQLIKYFLKQIETDTANKTIKAIGIAQADAIILATNLKDAITKETGFTNVKIVDTTPVISTHTGPGAIALMYYTE
ncbi:fatty acid-binding protein DegV [Anaerobacillus alkalilacustris]|uniref:Fatty acid-binding protein DegV n=1 Tax=Anaerobacillus alkalilacustris TaxID=393763 RepID=A0A1S2LTQ1_9BACI|nr:DegV family protein [Anaerobacillus alkalilacustris]OIJ14745.1 fatty acid-binding protein DegV [Anaerobacillus alkalilacustris]